MGVQGPIDAKIFKQKNPPDFSLPIRALFARHERFGVVRFRIVAPLA